MGVLCDSWDEALCIESDLLQPLRSRHARSSLTLTPSDAKNSFAWRTVYSP